MRRAPSRARGCLLLARALLCAVVFASGPASAQDQQRLPRQAATVTAALTGSVHDPDGRPVVGANIALTEHTTGRMTATTDNGDGVFRLLELAPGAYDLRVTATGYETIERDALDLDRGKVVTLELVLHPVATGPAPASRIPRAPELGPPPPPE